MDRLEWKDGWVRMLAQTIIIIKECDELTASKEMRKLGRKLVKSFSEDRIENLEEIKRVEEFKRLNSKANA